MKTAEQILTAFASHPVHKNLYDKAYVLAAMYAYAEHRLEKEQADLKKAYELEQEENIRLVEEMDNLRMTLQYAEQHATELSEERDKWQDAYNQLTTKADEWLAEIETWKAEAERYKKKYNNLAGLVP